MNTLTPELEKVLKDNGFNSPIDICHLSFDEFHHKMDGKLSWSKILSLYLNAQQDNRLHEARILKRANPQLQNAIHLALTTPNADLQGYNSKFGGRANQYVMPGAVSSMFSPAAYLTELYRQAQDLHVQSSIYHLDTRRPDLKSLTLSQQNMDDEVSTLSLSNKVLLAGIKTLPGLENQTKVMQELSTFHLADSMPYHDAYENIRKVIQLQTPILNPFNISPETPIAKLIYQTSLLNINASVSPDLFNILTTKVTEDNVQDLYQLSFGDISPTLMVKSEQLAGYYHLTDQEAHRFIKQEEIARVHQLMSDEDSDQPAQYYLLRLNKIIRLSRITELSPAILKNIISSSIHISQPTASEDEDIYDIIEVPALPPYNEFRDEPDINTETLRKVFHVKYYMQRYSIDAATALILCKIPISGEADTTNFSHLNLTKSLADIHQLTINELDLLLVAIGERINNLSEISDSHLAALIDKLYTVTEWLRTRKWSVYQLFVMATTSYDKTITPEIQNLLDTVYNGLQGFNYDESKPGQLLAALSPYVAAALQLSSENVAHHVLTWADQLKPGDGTMTAKKFWEWLQVQHDSEQPSLSVTPEHAAQYCQCLAQLALICHSTDLCENTLRLFVTKPQLFGMTALTHNALSLIMLTRFNDWVNSLDEKASSVLTAFEAKTLTAEQLTNAMDLDENLLLQASHQVQNNLSNWASIDTLQQWVSVARQLNISPQEVSTLAQLLTAESPPIYAQWENVAVILTAGLNTQKANTLHTYLDESRSTALSEYYIRKVANVNAKIKNRDDLYQYLLIDNQVSSSIKTTPIAEAIASIQLYINRALKNMEEDIVTNVTCRPFFTDWDKYNKRYSTWASVAKLIYYPENYIDPTIRIGQTKMMDALLQSVSQSQLNTDTVENAFMSYLTSFEQVANLEVVSAYHDNINRDRGLTYFIGHSKTEIHQYYWRSVDHNKFSDGKFAPNAWSEWRKIDCPMNPYNSTIRPVIYQSRLYLIWLEQKKIAKQTATNQTIEDYYYELKLAHIRYDATWSAPITFDVNDKISVVFRTLTPLEQVNTSIFLEQLIKYQKQLGEKLTEQQDIEEKTRLAGMTPLNPLSPPIPEEPQESSEILQALIKQRKEQLRLWEEELKQRGQSTTEISILKKQKELNQQEIQKQQYLLEQKPGFYCASDQDNKLLVMFYQKQETVNKYTINEPITGLNITSNMLSEDINLGDYITNTRKQFDTGAGINSVIKVNNSYETASSTGANNDNILTLYHNINGAQYIQWGAYRIRLNTLFARQLVNRATAGIDTILSMETQNIQEPQLGKGFYATFVIPPL
ncbi:neuraminidase-like domain-containing protein [Photorhabdus asymbiotica]|uniref:neuraminidase-like domain-containing protein n=1 Tax=Photorhabdus asymbiotica TaxID=291112 RepID=UPI003DA746B9